LTALVIGLMGLFWLGIVAGLPLVAGRVAGPAVALPEAEGDVAAHPGWPDDDQAWEPALESEPLPEVSSQEDGLKRP
jgi:hypothetical protein